MVGAGPNMAATYLIDSNTFAPLVRAKRDDPAVNRFYKELKAGSKFLLCPIALCELLVGLYQRNAVRQLERFLEIQKYFEYNEMIRTDWEKAAKIRSERKAEGLPSDLTDILIAVQANRLKATVITRNIKHFEGICNSLETWI